MLDPIDRRLTRADCHGNSGFGPLVREQIENGGSGVHSANPIREGIGRQYPFVLARSQQAVDHPRMSRLASNLRYLLDEVAKISENALSVETGVPQPTINRILSGKSRDPRDSTIEPIARYFRVSVEAMRRENVRETRKAQGRGRIAVDSDLLRQSILKSEQIASFGTNVQSPYAVTDTSSLPKDDKSLAEYRRTKCRASLLMSSVIKNASN